LGDGSEEGGEDDEESDEFGGCEDPSNPLCRCDACRWVHANDPNAAHNRAVEGRCLRIETPACRCTDCSRADAAYAEFAALGDTLREQMLGSRLGGVYEEEMKRVRAVMSGRNVPPAPAGLIEDGEGGEDDGDDMNEVNDDQGDEDDDNSDPLEDEDIDRKPSTSSSAHSTTFHKPSLLRLRDSSKIMTLELNPPSHSFVQKHEKPCNSRSWRLDQIYSTPAWLASGLRTIYTYDRGNNWTHLIDFHGEAPSGLIPVIGEERPQEIYCIAGEGRSVVEDIGGVECWDDLKKKLKHPRMKDHRSGGVCEDVWEGGG